jgi:hypothetical protein
MKWLGNTRVGGHRVGSQGSIESIGDGKKVFPDWERWVSEGLRVDRSTAPSIFCLKGLRMYVYTILDIS